LLIGLRRIRRLSTELLDRVFAHDAIALIERRDARACRLPA